MQDFNSFLDSLGLSFDWDPEILAPEHESVLGISSPRRGVSDIEQAVVDQRLMSDEAPFSNFGSRLPSLQRESNPDDGKIAVDGS
jgi:hypothetical protein